MTRDIGLDLTFPLPSGEKVTFEDVECEVEFSAHKGYPSSFYDPGEPNYVTVDKVFYDGADVTEFLDLNFIETLIDANEALEDEQASYIDFKIDELKEAL